MNPLAKMAEEFSIVHRVRNGLSRLSASADLEMIEELRAELLPLVTSQHLSHIDCEEKLLDGQPSILREVCEEIHMHLLAASLASPDRSDINSHDLSPTRNTIVRGLGGLTYSTINSNVVMLMPDCTLPGQFEQIQSEFLRIFDTQRNSLGWILDCSALSTALPILFIGSLAAYREDLKKRGHPLILCWLKPEFTTNIESSLFEECFEVERVGGYYFTRLE